jgi:hypothetical protein
MSTDAAKTVVRRNTEEVQSKGNFDVFEEVFADDFVDHTPQPNMILDEAGVRGLYRSLRAAFPDFRAEIHWQAADGELVTTYIMERTPRDPGAGPLGVPRIVPRTYYGFGANDCDGTSRRDRACPRCV